MLSNRDIFGVAVFMVGTTVLVRTPSSQVRSSQATPEVVDEGTKVELPWKERGCEAKLSRNEKKNDIESIDKVWLWHSAEKIRKLHLTAVQHMQLMWMEMLEMNSAEGSSPTGLKSPSGSHGDCGNVSHVSGSLRCLKQVSKAPVLSES
ncbi:hypothetical protein V5799_023048 [Amblyomma americanum]|uniref:Uncharacterized protein n=1 Tax=Amblyomma americanum TaxID=6943 RepID=A0AAQ4FJD9_AMBAM